MMLDIKAIWISEGYGKDNPWESSINYIYKIADNNGIEREITDAILTEFFAEVVNGKKKYSTEGCTCGCESTKSGTDAVHSIIKRILLVHEEFQTKKTELLTKNINTQLLRHINKQNKKYTRDALGPPRLINMKKSWVLNGFKAVTGIGSKPFKGD